MACARGLAKELRSTLTGGTSRQLMSAVAERLEGVRPDCDWLVFANLQKTLALALLNRAYLHADALEATVDALIEAMLDELFGPAGAAAVHVG